MNLIKSSISNQKRKLKTCFADFLNGNFAVFQNLCVLNKLMNLVKEEEGGEEKEVVTYSVSNNVQYTPG